MVPTYPRHLPYYEKLVASYHDQALFENQGVDFVTVFSSKQECRDMLSQCRSCNKTHVEVMIFDHPYNNVDKFNYQAAKKIWALDNMKQEHVLVMDSDFSFRPTLTQTPNFVDMARQYENVIYLTKSDFGLDVNVLENMNSLLDTQFDSFPLEPPWFFQKKHVTKLRQFLQSKWGTDDYVEMLLNGPTTFEIVLYRLFLMKSAETGATHVETIQTQSPTPGFIFDRVLSEAERLSMNPPPITLRCDLASKDPCNICWLQIHNDRGCM
eukprot:gnl/MRDRNA2_/MRDRNA2_86545_c0_seq1.p1 gnl/MRDRNA2_/MRDRNA2_86545_c0~~gnl/MRDRNA2_/MRDRNA2_86545_c0_seq1.p1  ORF type:complete len:309 (+),score=23.86 gnl/MRDRNA2_/MRDRNA2_86545_c0_seq1:128-928(+)